MAKAASARTEAITSGGGKWPTIGVSVVIFTLRPRGESHELAALLVRSQVVELGSH